MRELLIALNHLHKHNVMHRDVKPGNFLYSMDTSKGVLIDFGLAEDDRSKEVREALRAVPEERKKRKRVITNIVDDTNMSTTGSFTAASQRLTSFSMHRSVVSSAATSRKRPFSRCRHLIQVSGISTTAASSESRKTRQRRVQ